MPNQDGTGPRNINRRGGFFKQSRRQILDGTQECTCHKCGYKEPHKRGIPCVEKKCPKCNTPMKGEYC